MRKYGIEPKILKFAHNNLHDKPYLVLVGGKKGGRSGLNIEKPITVGEMNTELFGDEGINCSKGEPDNI